jgi:hypothetical protein
MPVTTQGTGPGLTLGNMNEFTLIMRVKPGGADKLRQIFSQLTDEEIRQVETVHNARFVLFDNDTRLLIATMFDGSWDQYIDDFYTKLGPAWDAIFSNVEGWPGLHSLEETAAFFNTVQVQASQFYALYPEASAKDVQKALRVKDLFDRALDEAQS